jgi:DNA-binding transcriptional regulator YdaS (Cro superfamily)
MAIQDQLDSPLALACRKAGGQTALARIVGKDQSTVYERLAKGGEIWPECVLKIEELLEIPRWVLRPDLYPPEEYSGSPGTQPDGASAEGRRKSSAGAGAGAGDVDPNAGLRS